MRGKVPVLLFRLILFVPLVGLIVAGFQGELGAQPMEELNEELGEWTLRLFLLNLYIGCLIAFWKPLPVKIRWILGQRRFLGVVTFFYAFLHVLTYFLKEGQLQPAIDQIIEKSYLQVGFAAFVIITILGITSNNFSVKRLKTKWKKLHRLVYVAAICLYFHLTWIEKADIEEAYQYLLPIFGLLIIRFGYWIWKKKLVVNS